MGLNKDEFDKICSVLGRVPNFTEVSVYSVMWSEPVSYTHLGAHETVLDLVCRLLLEKKKKKQLTTTNTLDNTDAHDSKHSWTNR